MINKSDTSNIRSVAIIGSGLAGLTAARLLYNQGIDATVFEKSRGPGGRLASKRVSGGSADMGAQYFTIRNPAFLSFLEQYAGTGTFAPWQGQFGYQLGPDHWEAFPDEQRYVGVPRMTAFSRALSADVNLVARTRIARLDGNHDGRSLVTAEGQRTGPFDAVVITAPPAQARDLLRASGLTDLAAELDDAVRHVQPCWAVAAHFTSVPFARYVGMRVKSNILSWVANNSSKPGRDDDGQWWVLHATSEWSQANVDGPAKQVAGKMIREFQAVTGTDLVPCDLVTHRWLYAKSSDPAMPVYHWFADERIGLAGDWLSGGRVEGAFDSASALVQAITEVPAY
ncbi:NAD(P)/FAD-dependent oxidoreductase [Marinobacter sp.]|uniref:NAD(P)/FAD-dependent oxidoreductase n=1 Tax=Marinobacter sp. TaxID=50741 RepID=UPI002B4834B0|nr:FAD-dependent oxidoreductase [Marinobacter sp.]HKK57686.1 FAD-dependent oxidoreductase [Marinobacter sp.]